MGDDMAEVEDLRNHVGRLEEESQVGNCFCNCDRSCFIYFCVGP